MIKINNKNIAVYFNILINDKCLEIFGNLGFFHIVKKQMNIIIILESGDNSHYFNKQL